MTETSIATPVEVAKPLPTSLVFIDGTNLDHRCWEAFGRTDIDFQKFLAALSAGTQLKHTHYFTAPYTGEREKKRQTGALNLLRKLGNVTVKLGRYQPRLFTCDKCRYEHRLVTEKGTDVGTACEMVRSACQRSADRLILVAGDNDFIPALTMARELKVHAEFAFVMGPNEDQHRAWMAVANMRHAARNQTVLDEQFMSKCWYSRVMK